ncbi:MAG: mechanosensitive ion channel [Microcoleaceae cyanobacterium]
MAQQTTGNTPNPFGLGGLSIGSFSVMDLIVALAILIIGYIIALFVKALVKSLLKKTDVDNKIASWVSGGRTDANTLPVEEWIGSTVFWLIFLFAIIGFLERLQLSSASSPLTSLLNQITEFIPRVLAAAALLGIAWIVATLVRALVVRVLDTFGLDRRLNNQVGNDTTSTTSSSTTTTSNQFSLSETIGNALYWFIFLLFLLPILDTLSLQGLLTPIQQMLNEVLFMLPNILAAILIGATGWVIAQVVRKIVTNLLSAIGTDQFGNRFGLSQATGTQGLSSIIGTVVYVLILIPIAIAALNALQIDAISVPAIEMLSQVLNIIPQIFAAAVILTVFYVIGRFVSELLTNILSSFGFNKLFYWLGLQSTPPVERTVYTPSGASEPGEPTILQPSSTSKTPSEIAGIVAFVGIMLFAVVTATDILGLASLTLILEQIIVIAGRVLIGVIVFAVGLYFANLAYKLVYSSGSSTSQLLAQTARIAIIVFVGAMALQMMGIASDIVNLAFGLLLGAIAVAVAISFGLGGRDIAAEEIRNFLSGFKRKQ